MFQGKTGFIFFGGQKIKLFWTDDRANQADSYQSVSIRSPVQKSTRRQWPLQSEKVPESSLSVFDQESKLLCARHASPMFGRHASRTSRKKRS